MDHRGRGPICDGFYLAFVHVDAVSVDEHPQVFYLRFVERAFFRSCKEVVVAEALQNLLHLGLMLGKSALGEDHDVVNVDDHNVFHVGEDFVHHSLERSRGVAESEEHDGGFVGSSMANERGFPFITFLNPYVVVAPPEVYLHEVL